MKKIKNLMTLIVIALVSFAFTSCDEDEKISDTLAGTWEGNIHVASKWRGSYYYATKSYVCFEKDPFAWSSGSGYWVDYYSKLPWDYIANHIDWSVKNGNIYVHFVEDRYDITIYRYRLNRNYFEGEIKTYDDKMVSFSLSKISAPNWRYDYHYGWDYWEPNFAKKGLGLNQTRASSGESDRPQREFRVKDMEK